LIGESLLVEQYKVFPTHIHIQDNILHEDILLKIRNDIIKSYDSNKSNWQSEPDIYNKEVYYNLKEKVLSDTSKILNSLGYDYEEIYITDMWSNILKPGESHKIHTHSNNYISGVFYVDADKSSGIIFNDPRPQANVIQPHITNKSIDNANSLSYESKTNRIIYFPSWLQHHVPINKTNKNRISIAFNLMFKGKIGNSKEFQSAIL